MKITTAKAAKVNDRLNSFLDNRQPVIKPIENKQALGFQLVGWATLKKQGKI